MAETVGGVSARASSLGNLGKAARGYLSKVRLFSRNARLYLLFVANGGLVYGVFLLLDNFYIVSLGYDESLLGQLIAVSSMMTLVAAVPAGYFSDRLGRKTSLIVGTFLIAGSIAGEVLYPVPWFLFLMTACFGLGESLWGVTSGPLLMENSGEEERTYLFSFTTGLNTLAGFVGSWVGGGLPSWLGGMGGFQATSPQAYGACLAAMAALAMVGLLPILLVRSQPKAQRERGPMLSPLQYARQHPNLLAKLISPILITSMGAGLLMPFMNIYFREAYSRSDAVIGVLFAWGSLAMAIGLLLAPPLADRWGKIKVVVISQAVSIPFLVALGFSPWYFPAAVAYLVRLALMNMSAPVYQAFVMERVDEEARATVASLVSMSWSFGWAFSPGVSGWLQVHCGFDPVFLGTIATYTLAIYLYWRFFGRAEPGPGPGQAAVGRALGQ